MTLEAVRLASAREAAEALGVSERTVRRWITSGALTAEKDGGAFAVDMDAARMVYERSRAGRTAARACEAAEMRGRYLEVVERLAAAESELAKERVRADRLEAILYMPAEQLSPSERKALDEGEADVRAGRVRPYEDVRRDVGLGPVAVRSQT